jgi:hypothetical protein
MRALAVVVGAKVLDSKLYSVCVCERSGAMRATVKMGADTEKKRVICVF